MSNAIPASAGYVVIGAGIHGLSTAWHLAMELEARGTGSGADIVVLDKTGPGAGASGIACGCVRNLYMTEPIHAILRHSVDVWTYDPVAFGFQQVGYVSAGEANQAADYEKLHASQARVGYPSDLYQGRDAKNFLKTDLARLQDRRHRRRPARKGERLRGHAAGDRGPRAEVPRSRRAHPVRRGGRRLRHDGRPRVEGAHQPRRHRLRRGRARARRMDAEALGDAGQADARSTRAIRTAPSMRKDMWTYWRLLEGEVYVDQPYRTASDLDPPVLHVELMSTPVIDPSTGRELADHLYVYWKNGAERMDRPGVQGGTIPIKIGPNAVTDPYGHANDEYQAEPGFADYLTSAMGQLMTRFEGIAQALPRAPQRRHRRVHARQRADLRLDRAERLHDRRQQSRLQDDRRGQAGGEACWRAAHAVAELQPFAFDRFANGKTFGASNSHCPWV